MSPLPRGRGRFAPSPSGPLHLGNLRTALLAWLFARHAGASFVLRNENLDRPRVQPGAEQAMIEDLRWLGLDWDEGPDVGGPHTPYIQSERLPLYEAHFQRLLDAGLVYPCYCSRRDVSTAASAPQEAATEIGGYPGTCRDPGRRGMQQRLHPERKPSYRFLAQGQTVCATDRLLGPISRTLMPGTDDFVIWRADCIPAYQLAVVVDDALMEIGEVVRGADLLDSTPLQIALFQAFAYPAPAYAHVPLYRDATGARIAKRRQATGLEALRSKNMRREQVVGMLAATCGLAPSGTNCLPADLVKTFRPAQIRERSYQDADP